MLDTTRVPGIQWKKVQLKMFALFARKMIFSLSEIIFYQSSLGWCRHTQSFGFHRTFQQMQVWAWRRILWNAKVCMLFYQPKVVHWKCNLACFAFSFCGTQSINKINNLLRLLSCQAMQIFKYSVVIITAKTSSLALVGTGEGLQLLRGTECRICFLLVPEHF